MALKECKECGQEVSTKADTCPNCGVNDPTTSTLSKIVSTIIGFVILGWFCSMLLGDVDSDTTNASTTSWKDEPDKIAAHTMIQGFVEDRLKAPSTAEFPSAWDYDYDENIDYEGNQTYYIESYVDSENSFGGTVRTEFTARIKQVSEDEWRLLELNLEE